MLKRRPDNAILPAPRILSVGVAAALSIISSTSAWAQEAVKNAGPAYKKPNSAQQKRAFELCDQGNKAKSRGNDREAWSAFARQ